MRPETGETTDRGMAVIVDGLSSTVTEVWLSRREVSGVGPEPPPEDEPPPEEDPPCVAEFVAAEDEAVPPAERWRIVIVPCAPPPSPGSVVWQVTTWLRCEAPSAGIFVAV